MPLARADHATRTLAVNADEFTVRSVISTIDPDRAGDIVIPTGIQNAEDYLLNPVVLWAHNRSQFPPIGVCEWLDVQPRRIVAETRFARGVPFAEDVFRLYEQGILRGWSIGSVPRQAKREARRDGSTGLRVLTWDLLEYSAVPIPENPDAVTVAIEKGFVRDPDLREWLLGECYVPDVLSGLIEASAPVIPLHSE
jgi:Escherichia/Staphylococcus phage prohead protease